MLKLLEWFDRADDDARVCGLLVWFSTLGAIVFLSLALTGTINLK